MGNVSFFKQTNVYFKKIARIAIREKVWKFVVFAVIIAIIVALVTGSKMFDTMNDTQSGFFVLASACIWIGIFNSIQSICKEHNIIRSEYRQGMKISSYITANVWFQFFLSLVESIVIFIVCIIFIDFSKNEVVGTEGALFAFSGGAYFEYFITILLLTFGSSVMGIMVSSISGNPTTAMTIMPFVLILQLIMSGVLFELTGFAEKVSYITFSKWGMQSFQSTAGANDLPLKINGDIDQMVIDAFEEAREIKECYNHEAGNVIVSWIWCIGITVVSAVVSIFSLKFKNRDS